MSIKILHQKEKCFSCLCNSRKDYLINLDIIWNKLLILLWCVLNTINLLALDCTVLCSWFSRIIVAPYALKTFFIIIISFYLYLGLLSILNLYVREITRCSFSPQIAFSRTGETNVHLSLFLVRRILDFLVEMPKWSF